MSSVHRCCTVWRAWPTQCGRTADSSNSSRRGDGRAVACHPRLPLLKRQSRMSKVGSCRSEHAEGGGGVAESRVHAAIRIYHRPGARAVAFSARREVAHRCLQVAALALTFPSLPRFVPGALVITRDGPKPAPSCQHLCSTGSLDPARCVAIARATVANRARPAYQPACGPPLSSSHWPRWWSGDDDDAVISERPTCSWAPPPGPL